MNPELETLVILKYGKPQVTYEYISRLPVEVIDEMAWLYSIRQDPDSIYGLGINIPRYLHTRACRDMLIFLCEYESRT